MPRTVAVDLALMPGQFHVLEFDLRQEAAAFIAALSRFLYSPGAEAYDAEDVEVWAVVLPSMPAASFLIIKGGETPALGADDAELRLSGK